MGWSIRGNRKYFYKAQREGNKVRKIYLGTGDVAQAASLALDIRKERREIVRVWLEESTRKFNELDVLDAALVVELAAVLYASTGFRVDAQAARRTLRSNGAMMIEQTACETPLSPEEKTNWQDLRERASRGDREAAEALLPLLDKHPELKSRWGDLSRIALGRWIQLLAGSDAVALRATHAKVLELVQSLRQEPSDPLEELLAQRVGLLWLQVHYFDTQVATAMNRTPREQEFLVARQQGAQKTYDAAIATLRNYQVGGHAAPKRRASR